MVDRALSLFPAFELWLVRIGKRREESIMNLVCTQFRVLNQYAHLKCQGFCWQRLDIVITRHSPKVRFCTMAERLIMNLV
jgi:hypothetical protein